MEFYWQLKYGPRDELKTLYIPPAQVANVQRKWDNGQPIHTTTGSIPPSQIKEFSPSDKPFGSQALLEAGARAFHEPIYKTLPEKQRFRTQAGETIEIPYEVIEGKWVKQVTTTDKWGRYYSAIPAYRLLEESGGMAIMAFKLATHDIDPTKTPECTAEEVKRLTRS